MQETQENFTHKNLLSRKSMLGFTLTELIVVITILSILGTIGFIAMQGYSLKARDSLRITDMSIVLKGLAVWRAQNDLYQIPENSIAILTASGDVISNQGYFGETLARQIKMDKVVVDPKDKRRYVYTIDHSRKKVQLMGYLESGETIARSISLLYGMDTAYASLDNQDRSVYVIGDQIGVLTDSDKTPVQDLYSGTGINLGSVDTTGLVAYFWGSTFGSWTSTGTGTILINQMLGAINGTIPCNPTTYNGYAVSALSHDETGIFTKTLSISNGSGTGTLSIVCQNGTLDTSHAVETSAVSCTSGFVNTGNNQCTANLCGGSIPANTQILPGSTQSAWQNWSHGTGVPGICVYECQNNYTWNSGSCSDLTPPTIASITTSSPACNTVRVTINSASDAIALHSTPYSFDGGSTWQGANFKDFNGTSYTGSANLFKVQDMAGNIYSHASIITGTATSCAVNGACWSANGTASITYGWQSYAVAGPCGTDTGNPSQLCNATFLGTLSRCSSTYNPGITTVPVLNDLGGACNKYDLAPSANLCTTGTATVVSGSGPWTWTCQGQGGGTSSACNTSAIGSPTCGSVYGSCLVGRTDIYTKDAGWCWGNWSWSCVNGAVSTLCHAGSGCRTLGSAVYTGAASVCLMGGCTNGSAKAVGTPCQTDFTYVVNSGGWQSYTQTCN